MAAIQATASASLVTCKAARASAPQALFAPCAGLKSGKSMKVFSQAKTVDEQFALVKASCRSTSSRGALGARCDAGAEVLKIVPVMFGMIFTGIALGFVLLRVEAYVDEASKE